MCREKHRLHILLKVMFLKVKIKLLLNVILGVITRLRSQPKFRISSAFNIFISIIIIITHTAVGGVSTG